MSRIACPAAPWSIEALQFLAELGIGLEDTAALRRVAEGLQGGVPKCCIAFTLFYGRAIDAGRQLTLDEIATLAEAFSDSDLPYRVDVMDWQGIDDRWRQTIAAQRIALTEAG